MKPPSRKHYEKHKPTYKELEAVLKDTQHKLMITQHHEQNLNNALKHRQTVVNWFRILKHSEVMIITPEGIKYLTGDDLEKYCEAQVLEIAKREKERHEGYETINIDFAGFAHQAIRQIIVDEIDKADVLDSFTYTTKGRYGNDAGSESKEEGS